MDYQSLSAAELIAALDNVGRTPDPELIRCCLARGEEIKSGLLARIEQLSEPSSDDDDLRPFGEIHAALLLIELHEPAALPYFEQAFRDEARDYLLEWFAIAVPNYGPIAASFLTKVVNDPGVFSYGRAYALESLSRIAWHNPNERQRVIDTARALLPRLDEHGELVLPAEKTDPDDLWSWAVVALGDLHDTDSKALVAALDQHELLDRFLLGTGEELLEAFEVGAVFEPREPYDMLSDYEISFKTAQKERPEASSSQSLQPTSASESTPPPLLHKTTVSDQRPLVRTSPKIGPNERCPCGSGKKYKKCCQSKEQDVAQI